MGDNAIEFEGVSKRYRLGEHLGGLSEAYDLVVDRLRGRPVPENRYLWALKDISIEIPSGEALGIVGRNGAGKSTFLKTVAGVTTPTLGVCRTRGRIGSLLEIGTGFSDDLTGRENTFLSGAIIGMTRREVAKELDEIVAFAGLEDFIDAPVKTYSSGMYVRLAFAIAINVDPSLLIIDEILAVGHARLEPGEQFGWREPLMLFVQNILIDKTGFHPSTCSLDAMFRLVVEWAGSRIKRMQPPHCISHDGYFLGRSKVR